MRKTSKKSILLIISTIFIALTVSTYIYIHIQAQQSTRIVLSGKIAVVASFYPLYYFTKAIGGDYLAISMVVPSGAEPHEYEPTPQQRAKMEKSALLILNGARFEPWGEKVSAELQKKGVKVISVADHLQLREIKGEGGIKDPHIWLSPHYAQKVTEQILQGLVEIDPKHAEDYKKNAQLLFARFNELDNQFHEGLEQCKNRDFITSHAAFGYMADEYKLHQLPIQISSDTEPSATAIAGVIDFAKTHSIEYIFFESLVSSKLSEMIAKEVGAKTLVLDPIEGVSENEIAKGSNYFSIMENNLVNLRTALQCN